MYLTMTMDINQALYNIFRDFQNLSRSFLIPYTISLVYPTKCLVTWIGLRKSSLKRKTSQIPFPNQQISSPQIRCKIPNSWHIIPCPGRSTGNREAPHAATLERYFHDCRSCIGWTQRGTRSQFLQKLYLPLLASTFVQRPKFSRKEL
jgi:hypothetical protein